MIAVAEWRNGNGMALTEALRDYVGARYSGDREYSYRALRVLRIERNAFLDHTCVPCVASYHRALTEHCDTCMYEVQACIGDHVGHLVECVATVQYAENGARTLVAVTTCGRFSVWMD